MTQQGLFIEDSECDGTEAIVISTQSCEINMS